MSTVGLGVTVRGDRLPLQNARFVHEITFLPISKQLHVPNVPENITLDIQSLGHVITTRIGPLQYTTPLPEQPRVLNVQ